ncbi:hypothetical protein LSP03_11670 [Lysinibacillus sphaericus]|nr:hypothetical protein LSP03_11670 [Lysinibacillus sphaericus]
MHSIALYTQHLKPRPYSGRGFKYLRLEHQITLLSLVTQQLNVGNPHFASGAPNLTDYAIVQEINNV